MSIIDFDHLAPDRDRQFISVGGLCQILQILPGQLRVLMESADVKFAQVVDGVGFVTLSDAELIAAMGRDVVKEIDEAQQAAKHN